MYVLHGIVRRTAGGCPSEVPRMKMEATEQRNGVLLYISPADHKAAIWGDSGIHDATRKDFWNEVLEEMLSFFREERLWMASAWA